MMLCGEISDEEKKENKYVVKFDHTYSVDDNLFSAYKLSNLRKREQVLMERNKKGYYQCKERDYELFDAMIAS